MFTTAGDRAGRKRPTRLNLSGAGSGVVDGSGTLNTIPIWSPDGNTLGDSSLTRDPTSHGLNVFTSNGVTDVLRMQVDGGSATVDVGFQNVDSIIPQPDNTVTLGSHSARWNQNWVVQQASGGSNLQLATDDSTSNNTVRLEITAGDNDGVINVGQAHLQMRNLSTSAACEIRFFEPGNTNYTAFKAGAQSTDFTYTLPTTAPTASQVLTSSGGDSSTLSWTTAAGTIGGSGTANKVAKFTGAGITIGNSQIWDDGSNVNVGETGNSAGLLTVHGDMSIFNGPGAKGLRLAVSGGNSFDLNSLGLTATQQYTVPTAAPTVNGAVLTSTIAGQWSWTSSLPASQTGYAFGAI